MAPGWGARRMGLPAAQLRREHHVYVAPATAPRSTPPSNHWRSCRLAAGLIVREKASRPSTSAEKTTPALHTAPHWTYPSWRKFLEQTGVAPDDRQRRGRHRPPPSQLGRQDLAFGSAAETILALPGISAEIVELEPAERRGLDELPLARDSPLAARTPAQSSATWRQLSSISWTRMSTPEPLDVRRGDISLDAVRAVARRRAAQDTDLCRCLPSDVANR